jgi:MoxR-like ATPase
MAQSAFDILDALQGVQASDIESHADKQVTNQVLNSSDLVVNPRLVRFLAPDFLDVISFKAHTFEYGVKDIVRMITPQAGKPRVYPVFFGPAGTGKSVLVKYIYDQMNKDVILANKATLERNKVHAQAGEPLEEYAPLPYPLYDVQCHEATRSEDLTLTTRIVVREGEAVMEEVMNAALKAYTQGGILDLEEWDVTLPGVWSELNGILEPSNDTVMFYANGPKQYVRHENFVCVASSNTKGRGENSVAYGATTKQNNAFRSRFMWFPVGWMPAGAEIKILCDKGVRRDVAEKLVFCAGKIRAAVQRSELDVELSIRVLIAWAYEAQAIARQAGYNDSTPIGFVWKNSVQPAAYPSFIWQMEDEEQIAVAEYLNIV